MENGEGDKKKDDIYAYRTREEALGAERTIVVTYEQKLYNRNLRTFIKGIDKRRREFEELESKIGRRRYRTKSAIEKKAEKIQKDEEPNNDQPKARVPLDGPEDKSTCLLLCSRIDAITAPETQITAGWH